MLQEAGSAIVSLTKEMNPITRESMTFEKTENKRQMYGSGSTQACLLFSGFSNVCHFTCIWPRALKLGCVTNVDMLFLTNGFICLFYENKFVLISGGHISNRPVYCTQCYAQCCIVCPVLQYECTL